MRRAAIAVLLGFGLLLGVGIDASRAAPGRPVPEHVRAWRAAQVALGRGTVALAVREAEACVTHAPASAACASVLGRALAASDRCAWALGPLARAQGSAVWGWRDAWAQARCLDAVGRPAASDAAFSEAVSLAPARGVDDVRAAWAITRALRGEAARPWPTEGAAVARVRLAAGVAAGGHAADRALAEAVDPWAGVGPDGADVLAWLGCEAALAGDDPHGAIARASAGPSGGAAWRRALGCRAEAMRRLGDPWAPDRLASQPWLGPSPDWLWPVLACAAADRGDHDAAVAALRHAPAASAAVVAYVAARRGGVAPAGEAALLLPWPERA